MKHLILVVLMLVSPVWALEPQLDHAYGPALSSQALAFSPDAKKLAVAGSDGVKIYETATGRLLETRQGCGWITSSVAWSRDGKNLAAGGLTFGAASQGEIVLWRFGRAPLRWTTGSSSIDALAFSPDSSTLVTAGVSNLRGDVTQGSARLWDVGSGKLRHTLGTFRGSTAAVAFTGSGKGVAFSTSDGSADRYQTTLCDVFTGRVIQRWAKSALPLFMNGEKPLFQKALLARSTRKGADLRVEEIDGADHMRYHFMAWKPGVNATVAEADLGIGASCAVFGGDYLAATMIENFYPGYVGSVVIWKIKREQLRPRKITEIGKCTAIPVSLSAYGGRLILATRSGTTVLSSGLSSIYLLHRFNPRNIWIETAPSISNNSITFDGLWVDLKDVKAGQLAPRQSVEDFSTGKTEVSPDGYVLAGNPGVLHFAAAQRNQKATPFLLPTAIGGSSAPPRIDLEGLAWAPDSARVAILASLQGQNRCFIFSRTGKFEREIKGKAGSFSAVAFSPDGSTIATAVNPTSATESQVKIELWNADSGYAIRQISIPNQWGFEGDGAGIQSLHFSTLGDYLGGGGIVCDGGIWKSCVTVFDAFTGRKINTVPLPFRAAGYTSDMTKDWAFSGEDWLSVLHNNAVENWDFHTRRLEESVYLVPKGNGLDLLESH